MDLGDRHRRVRCDELVVLDHSVTLDFLPSSRLLYILASPGHPRVPCHPRGPCHPRVGEDPALTATELMD